MLAAQMTKIQQTAAANAEKKNSPRVSYDNYQIWRVIPSTQGHLEFLRDYKDFDDSEQVLWLKGPSMR